MSTMVKNINEVEYLAAERFSNGYIVVLSSNVTVLHAAANLCSVKQEIFEKDFEIYLEMRTVAVVH